MSEANYTAAGLSDLRRAASQEAEETIAAIATTYDGREVPETFEFSRQTIRALVLSAFKGGAIYETGRRATSDMVLVPRDPGTCHNDDSGWLLEFMRVLHGNVPEGEQPKAWMDFSGPQVERIQAAWRVLSDHFASPAAAQ